ncbi:MAG: type ISP restriction/modification enzyme [Cyclobacteriaceae bacterium]
MPTSSRIRSFARNYASQYSSDTAEKLAIALSELNRSILSARKQTEKILNTEWGRQPASRHVLADLLDLLKLKLSEEASAKDVFHLLAEQYLLSHMLKADEKQGLEKDSLWQQLALTNPTLNAYLTEKINSSDLRAASESVASLLPDRTDFYQLIPPLFQPQQTAFLMPAGKWQYVLGEAKQLLRKRMGISLNNDPLTILSCQLSSEHILSFAASADIDHRLMASHLTLSSYTANLLQNNAKAKRVKQSSSCFGDILVKETSGRQASLFTTEAEPDCVHQLRSMSYDLAVADLSQLLPSYSYHSKAYSHLDQEIMKVAALQNASGSPEMQSRMIIRLVNKAASRSMLLLSIDRTFLFSVEANAIRQYLSQNFEEIYVLDLPSQSEQAYCFIFLLRNQPPVSEKKTKVFYSRLETEPDKWPEEVSWSRVEDELHTYWIGFDQSDFFSFPPLYTEDEKGIFLQLSYPSATVADEWLTDLDEKQLRKKVLYLFRAYEKLKLGKASEQTSWPEPLRKMAEAGISLTFDEKKMQQASLSPFVMGYLYAEEKLLHTLSEEKALWWQPSWQQLFPVYKAAFKTSTSDGLMLPLINNGSSNISENGLNAFKKFYEERSLRLPASQESFPPAIMTAQLEQMSLLSQDLPVIRKYPIQIGKKLEAAEAFASKPELLMPLGESIEDFRQTIFRLERDAVERRGLYQRIRGILSEFEAALAALSNEQDEARKDFAAVGEESIFYYCLAVLAAPQYSEKYGDPLQYEIPRAPLLADFRKWCAWGKEYFRLINKWYELEPYPLKVEKEEETERASKYFSTTLMPASASLHLKEEKVSISLRGLPEAAFDQSYLGKSPLEHYLDYLQKQSKLDAKLGYSKEAYLLRGKENLRIREIQQLCTLSLKLQQLRREMASEKM